MLTRKVSGRLMGGTALALHLRHRASEDIDVMTFKDFSGSAIQRRMPTHLAEAYPDGHSFAQEVLTVEQGGYYALIGGIKVDVFQAKPTEGRVASQMRWLERPVSIDGVPVGAVPDIFASKLDVIMFRPKLRDYIDIAAIDRHSGYSLEDGIEFYRRKYGYIESPSSHVLRRIVSLLEDPGTVHADPRFEMQRQDALAHLETRAQDLSDYLADIADKDVRLRSVAAASDLGAPRPRPCAAGTCGRWMPRSRKHCVLNTGHGGGCRSRK